MQATYLVVARSSQKAAEILACNWHSRAAVVVPDVEREYRFLLTSAEARAFVAVGSEHLLHEVYDHARPVTYTRTTYFDTESRQYWRDEKNGLSRRVRVRQYANAESLDSLAQISGNAFFEFKESAGDLRQKKRWATSPGALRNLFEGRESGRELAELREIPTLLDLATEIRDGRMRPVFSTWYRRVSLVNRHVRLTIDENVAFCPPFSIGDVGHWASPSQSFDMVAGRIVEVKVMGPPPSWLRAAMETLSGTETLSKFHRGMQLAGTPARTRQSATRPLEILAPIRPRREP